MLLVFGIVNFAFIVYFIVERQYCVRFHNIVHIVWLTKSSDVRPAPPGPRGRLARQSECRRTAPGSRTIAPLLRHTDPKVQLPSGPSGEGKSPGAGHTATSMAKWVR